MPVLVLFSAVGVATVLEKNMVFDDQGELFLNYTAVFPYILSMYCSLFVANLLETLKQNMSEERHKALKSAVYTGIYVVCLILLIAKRESVKGSGWSVILFMILLLVGRVFSIIKNRKKVTIARPVAASAGLVILILIMLFMIYVYAEFAALLQYMVAFIVTVKYMIKVIMISFSRINLSVLKKILKKSYAGETLFGLVVLMLGISIYLPLVEPGFENFGDALWYCFAIVTTIGFGDMTATSTIGRILSVILGVYGILVVSLITSIIINFYTETRNDDSERKDSQNREEKEGRECISYVCVWPVWGFYNSSVAALFMLLIPKGLDDSLTWLKLTGKIKKGRPGHIL